MEKRKMKKKKDTLLSWPLQDQFSINVCVCMYVYETKKEEKQNRRVI